MRNTQLWVPYNLTSALEHYTCGLGNLCNMQPIYCTALQVDHACMLRSLQLVSSTPNAGEAPRLEQLTLFNAHPNDKHRDDVACASASGHGRAGVDGGGRGLRKHPEPPLP